MPTGVTVSGMCSGAAVKCQKAPTYKKGKGELERLLYAEHTLLIFWLIDSNRLLVCLPNVPAARKQFAHSARSGCLEVRDNIIEARLLKLASQFAVVFSCM